MLESELISVIIPAYNCAATLPRAVESALAQTYKALEILVIDDASKDDTPAVAARYPAVTYVRQPKNGGASAARNAGIARAKGAYIAFLDADDEWLPQKLAKQMELMRTSPLRPSLVTCNSVWIGNSEADKDKNYYLSHPPSRGDRVWIKLLEQNFIPTPTVLIKRSVFDTVKPFDEKLKIAEDLDLWIRIAERHAVDYLDDILVRFHMRAGSLMHSTALESIPITLGVIEKHSLGNARLTASERARVFGVRHHAYTYELYKAGMYREALKHGAACLRQGHRVPKTLALMAASRLKLLAGE